MNKLEPGTKLLVGSHETEVLKYLAEGGFAHIYTVKLTPAEDGKDVGVLKRVIVKSKKDLNLLRREVDTMQKLAESKYVVRLFDSNAQKLPDGTYEVLLLMEYCPNKSLLDYMNLHLKTKLNFEQITKIMYQISLGIYSMHSIQLIHRDLKIENVLIDSDGNFKLADFGSSSSFINPPTNQEEFEHIVNDIIHNTTPQYRAPEMIDLYKNIPIDEKSDIWALGVFLYKLLYYTTPFETQGELSILHGYYQFPPEPRYTSKLINLIIIMLQVDPQLRPNIYQVICVICKMTDKPVPVKDIYGLGPYDFDAYNKYQQQLQLHQQKQHQLQQQQQYLQQQNLKDEQRGRHGLEAQSQQLSQNPTSVQPSEAISKSPKLETLDSDKFLDEQPHNLAYSSKSSVVDLEKLSTESQEELVDDSNKNHAEDLLPDEENSPADDLRDVEERFPELDDLDDEIIKQKYPEVETDSGIEMKEKALSSTSSKSGEQRSTSGFSRSSSTKLSKDNAKSLPSSKDEDHLGLKLAHTEAWTDLPTRQSTDKDIDVHGVFLGPSNTSEPAEKIDSIGPLPQIEAPKRPNVSKKNSFDALFDFDDSDEAKIVSNTETAQGEFKRQLSTKKPDSEIPAALQASRNPFSPAQQQPQTVQQQKQQLLLVDTKKSIQPEASGSNPWAHYTASTSVNLLSNVNHQPHRFQQTVSPAELNPQYRPYDLSPSQVSLNHPSRSMPVGNNYYPSNYNTAPYHQNDQQHYQQQQQQQQRQQPQSQPQPPPQQQQQQQQQSQQQQQQPLLQSRNFSQPLSTNGGPPLVTISADENLINPHDLELKPKARRQFNLDMLDLDVASAESKPILPKRKPMNKNKAPVAKIDTESTIETNERENSDTDTDSDGGLKVEEMQVESSRKPSGSSPGSNIRNSSSGASIAAGRKSMELQKFNLDFKELGLSKDEGAIVDGSSDDSSEDYNENERPNRRDKEAHDRSRRSLSIGRSNSILNPRSRSISKMRKSVEEPSSKRRSFLGF